MGWWEVFGITGTENVIRDNLKTVNMLLNFAKPLWYYGETEFLSESNTHIFAIKPEFHTAFQYDSQKAKLEISWICGNLWTMHTDVCEYQASRYISLDFLFSWKILKGIILKVICCLSADVRGGTQK